MINKNHHKTGNKVKKIIVGNWKMNGSLSFIQSYFEDFRHFLQSMEQSETIDAEIVFCPPFPYLPAFGTKINDLDIKLGAQNCHEQKSGAFTGDVSCAMLQDFHCTYVIVGHSERRQGAQESNMHIQKKAEHALITALKPIICVGETLAERQSGQAETVILKQLHESLPALSATPYQENPLLVAYEPIWAIGTGLVATIMDITAMHAFIRRFLQAHYGVFEGARIPILYGGSVTAENAAAILSTPDVNGVLVGGASLKPEMFAKIITAA